tara:strand:- start:540 stop:803 length:264 start_codon:yes stop_codon:yes gene_type:complete
MSAIHQCNDGTTDITGRATPREYVACSSQGGEVGKSGQQIKYGPTYLLKDENPTGSKEDKTKQLIFVVLAAGGFAILGHWMYKTYLK